MTEGGYYGTTCFLAQQIAEKYLKGFLVYYGKDPGKIHALLALLKRCIQIDSKLKSLEKACRRLDKYYIEPRYADFPIDYSKKETEQVLNDALYVRDLIRKTLVSSFTVVED
ncbi:hypothetical protein A2696_00350 [Candidatus Curtissbacteria bacterium RIFCSPHIGHO2_01_FULL_41_13]|uniref:HEPN domain-containing protein n=1 Tax=Candidatus Curtissbacteria bacterium RIFCSPHIGHO2_01_FULL_41_13 TaxID=1797745 RepID=A0A1F5G2H1_9BACT|nr:MAG: hypothetical protein A2696_00350 [Candidatus Curtissbacteria bacterium RIFCSPHIGHO2_01_FULL_41_13]